MHKLRAILKIALQIKYIIITVMRPRGNVLKSKNKNRPYKYKKKISHMQLHNILKTLKFLPLIWGLKYEICCWLVSWDSLIGLWLYNIRTLCQIEDGSGHFEPLVSIGDLQSVQQSHDIRPLLLHTQLHPPPTLHWEQGTEE